MQPLAERFRPKSIEDIVGQEHVLGEGKALRNLIENKKDASLVLYGRPGVGKSTIAKALSTSTGKKLFTLNGTTASVKDIQAIAKSLDETDTHNGVVVYFDEFHAFSKSRQSSLLSYLENGQITLIASTTESPYHSIHPAILSRCMVFELKPINTIDITKRLKVCIEQLNKESINITFDEDALEFIAHISDGDLRKAISILELTLNCKSSDIIHIDKTLISEITQKNIVMDKSQYYDCISMLQKSLRGSCPEGSLIALCMLLEGGVDLDIIIRRLLVIASEDIGMGMGNLYSTFYSLTQAAKQVGGEECYIILSHAVILLATAPKSSTSYTAIKLAMHDVKNTNIGSIQTYLRDSHYSGAKDLGITGYKNPHNYPNNYVEQEYMPESLKGRVYYKPGNNKYERAIKEYWEKIKNKPL